MSKRTDDEKRRFWQPMIAHINATWKAAAKKECNYPFTGKDMADLRHHSLNFNEWGLMALWDKYIADADDYVKKHGFNIFTFTRSLPRLLDSNWKPAAHEYEVRLCGEFPAQLDAVLAPITAKKLPPKPNVQSQRIRGWGKARALREAQIETLPGF